LFFLTPTGYAPKDTNFKPVSYKQVLRILRELEPELKGEVKIFLKHFVECIERNIIREVKENGEI